MLTPEELEQNHAKFAADLAEAKASGLPFRTEYRADGARFVYYLTEQEIADAQARAQAELESNVAIDLQIAMLEGGPLYLSRPVREFTLAQILYNHLRDVHGIEQPMVASSELKAQGVAELTDAPDPTAQPPKAAGAYFNKGFTNMKALDDQIRALRAQRI